MIITLDEAKKLLNINLTDSSRDFILEEQLKSLEVSIRNYTNNKFLDERVKILGSLSFSNNSINGADLFRLGFRKGDTIEIDYTLLNNGIYTVKEVTKDSLEVEETLQEEEPGCEVLVNKINYPYDLRIGVVKLLGYSLKMADKIGVKSETISRYSVTYYDVNSTENIEGYPSSMMKFLSKYRKLRW